MVKTLPAALLAALLWLAAGSAHAQQPAGLEAALRTALRLHPVVSGKQAQVEAKQHVGEAVRSQRYPSLSAQAQRSSGAQAGGGTTPVTLRARQPLWAFGRIDNALAYAEADAEVERADLRRVQRELLQNTALAYAAVLGSQRRLQLAQHNTEAHQALFDQIQRRERGQLASRADVNLAATRLAQARAREQRFAGELEVAQSDLLAWTQQPVAAGQPVPQALTALPGAEAVLEMALGRSAEVALKEQQVERARAAVAQARTAAMPTVYLQAEHWRDQPGMARDSRVSVVVEAALDGLGGAVRGQSAAALSQLEAAQQDLLALRNDTSRSVRRLLANRQTLQALIATQAASLQDLAALLESYKRQYEAGTKSWLDLLNMQREASEQHLQQVQADSDWLAQSLQLTALIGGLDTLADTPAAGAATTAARE